ELELWTPAQWFERAAASARRPLNGQQKENNKPSSRPNPPEEELAMLGARHPECGYVWGEGDALHLLGEVLQEQDHEAEARATFQECLALRERIRDYQAAKLRTQL